MKKLAIKGHSTRGKEVIELLKMMGGEAIRVKGNDDTAIYVIPNNGIIDVRFAYQNRIDDFAIFTLEEFLEKYPFKVGDKVEVYGTNKVFTIGNMIWEDELCTVHYFNIEDIEYYTADELKPYKETNMEDNKVESTGFMQLGKTIAVCFNKENYENEVELQLGNYEIEVRDGKTYAVLKEPKYPKSFEECLNILYCKSVLRTIIGHKAELLFNLEKLLICRDAYWKIYGEEIGLDKHWEPDRTSGKPFYCISVSGNIISKGRWYVDNKILAFPTEEMRDAFYENFKDLIEQCKELL